MSASYRTLRTKAMRLFSLIIVVRNRIVASSSIVMTLFVKARLYRYLYSLHLGMKMFNFRPRTR